MQFINPCLARTVRVTVLGLCMYLCVCVMPYFSEKVRLYIEMKGPTARISTLVLFKSMSPFIRTKYRTCSMSCDWIRCKHSYARDHARDWNDSCSCLALCASVSVSSQSAIRACTRD